MRVQQCPSCGARYNVARLDDGATFQCRRCQAVVRVGEAAASEAPLSGGLAVAGILMLGVVFLQSNPGFGATPDWPWENFLRSDSWLVKGTFLAWSAAGVWAILSALVPAARARAAVAVPLAAALAVLCTTPMAGFSLLTLRLPQMLAAMALGAGLSLAPRESTARVGRWLAFAGGATILIWHCVWFPPDSTVPEISVLVSDLVAAVTGDPLSNPSADYLWQTMAPKWPVLLAGLLGVFVGLGLTRRAVTSIAQVLLVGGLLLPSAVALVKELDAFSLTTFRHHALDALEGHGVALWAFGAAAAADLVRGFRRHA